MVLDLDKQILNFDLLARSTWEVSKVRAEEASMARDRLTQEGILFRDNNSFPIEIIVFQSGPGHHGGRRPATNPLSPLPDRRASDRDRRHS